MKPIVTLESRTAAHAEELFPVLSEGALYEFLDEEPPASIDALRQKFARSESRKSPDGSEHWLNWVVRDASGKAAGHVQATITAKGTNVAYVIGSAYWGRGIATAAVSQMLEMLTADFGVREFEVMADRDNARSLRLAQALGFVEAPAALATQRRLRPGDSLMQKVMPPPVLVRAMVPEDFMEWKPLWDGYNAFYGRKGPTALPPEVTSVTWHRFFDADEPIFGLVAESGGKLLGLVHYLFHRSTTRIELTCYLQDLFTAEGARGRGIGRALIQGVHEASKAAGINRVYWHTHETNAAGRLLYDQVATHAGFIVYTDET